MNEPHCMSRGSVLLVGLFYFTAKRNMHPPQANCVTPGLVRDPWISLHLKDDFGVWLNVKPFGFRDAFPDSPSALDAVVLLLGYSNSCDHCRILYCFGGHDVSPSVFFATLPAQEYTRTFSLWQIVDNSVQKTGRLTLSRFCSALSCNTTALLLR